MRFKALLLILMLLAAERSWSQSTESIAPAEQGIKVSAFAEQSKVPLNRTVQVTIRLEWSGDKDRYEITDVESLTAQNFEVVSTSSANKVAMVNGQNRTIHDFQYVLQPVSMGMGYVNGLTIKYADAGDGKQYRLWTNRVEIMVLDPLAEPGAYNWIFYLLASGLVLAAAGYGLLLRRRKKAAEQEQALARARQQRPLEERYLEALKEQVPLTGNDLVINDALSSLSKLVRKYWAEKYPIPGLQASSEEFLAALQTQPVEERVIREVREVLQTADVAKFSGTGADRPTLERLYTLFEFQLKAFVNQPQSM